MPRRANVFDVAAYILKKVPKCTHMKLQKLVYYSQAWSLVWEERALFLDRIEAWANGPVVPRLYQALKGEFIVPPSKIDGDPSVLSKQQRETIEAVVGYYGEHTAQWLSDLTHSEAPWMQARRSIPSGERGSIQIPLASMAEYYSSLTG